MFRFQSFLPQSDDVQLATRSEVPVHHSIPADDVSGSTGTREYLVRLPGRFIRFMFRKHAMALKICIMALVFISAVYTKDYTGDHQQIINNHIGGIFYVIFGSLGFSILFPHLRLFMPVLIATSATCFLELVQWFRFSVMVELTQNKVFAYLFGNSFNPVDFVYYGAGALVALLVLWFIRD